MSICGFRIRAVAGWRGHLDGAQRFLHEATVVALAVHTSLAGQVHLRGVAPPVVLPRPRTCTPAAPPGQRAPAMQAPLGRNTGPIILLGAVLAGIRSHRFRTRCIKAIACPVIAYRQDTTASQDQAPKRCPCDHHCCSWQSTSSSIAERTIYIPYTANVAGSCSIPRLLCQFPIPIEAT